MIIRFLIFLSLLVPIPFFYSEHRISDFIALKLLFLFAAMTFIFIKPKLERFSLVSLSLLVVILVAWVLFWQMDSKKIVAAYTLICPILYYFVVVNSNVNKSNALGILFILLIIEMGLSIYHFGPTKFWKLGPVYIGGHFAMPLLMLFLAFSFKKNLIKIISMVDLLYGAGGRFLLPLMIAFFKKRALLVGIVALLFIYFFTIFLSMFDDNYLISAGYRVNEYLLVYDSLRECHLSIGCALEKPFETYKLGSKGVVEVGGHFHNHWLIWLYNFGFLGLGLAIYIYGSLYKKAGPYGFIIFALIIMMFFDAPRDGHWIIGFIAGVFVNENRLRTERLLS